jgi:hypothetical protein
MSFAASTPRLEPYELIKRSTWGGRAASSTLADVLAAAMVIMMVIMMMVMPVRVGEVLGGLA